MKNTGIVYDSTEKTPVTLPEFAGLLPPLTGEQLAALEADIMENGCYSPLIVNEDLEIVDGHHRRALCEKHGIPYNMVVFHFDDRLDAMRWAVETQRARRNLTAWELGQIALKLKPELRARGKANQSAGGGDKRSPKAKSSAGNSPSEMAPVNTRKELAASVGIGQNLMGKIIKIDEKAPQAVKDALDSGEISVNKGYEITRKVQNLPEEEREKSAELAVEFEKMKKDLRRSDAEIDRQAKIAGTFCKAFEKSFDLRPTEENIGYWVDFTRMGTREIKRAIDEARELSETYVSIERILRRMYPDAAAALDEEDRQIAEDARNAGNSNGGRDRASSGGCPVP